jgi:hypothetical protein
VLAPERLRGARTRSFEERPAAARPASGRTTRARRAGQTETRRPQELEEQEA